MAAYAVPVSKADWPIVSKYLSALQEGGILISPNMVRELEKQAGKPFDGEVFLDDYEFGGEADLWVDIVRAESHMAFDAVLETLIEE